MHFTLTRSAVHRHACELPRCCLALGDYSPACTARVLLHVLSAACARLCSLSAARLSLASAPSRETVRKAWPAWMPARDGPLRRLNRALTADVPRALRRRPQRVAIDLTLVPYHGKPMLDLSEVYRGQARDGTSHFHAYATAYVNCRGQRFALALTVVGRGERMEEVVRRLLKRLAALGIRTQMLLLGRGPWSAAVTRHLRAARKPFLVPVILRGRKAGHPRGPSGTRVFGLWKSGGWGEYTLTGGDGRTARVSIRVRRRSYGGQWGRRGRRALAYAYRGFVPPSTAWAREAYRSRFAIETGYRRMQQGRARTSTRNPRFRPLLVGVAPVPRNAWVWLHYACLSTPRRGGRRLDLERLPLKTLLRWLQHQAEHELGWCDRIQAERPGPRPHNS